jgi:hypothetical protein
MTSSGSFSTNTRHNAPVAAAIFARPLYQSARIPNIAIIGDSIGSGTSDTSYYAGYPQYGIIRAGNLAFVNLAIGSDAAVTWGTLANCYRRAALAEDCDWAMNEHGVNDLQADPTSMMVNMMALDLRLSQLGMRVCHPTITPRTTSATSNWIGTYNQVAFDVRCGPTYALQGTATSGAAGSITDSAKTLNTAPYSTSYASFAGYYVSIESGTGAGQRRKITGITGTSQINVTPNWAVTPDATSAYVIRCTRVEYNDWVRSGCPVDSTFTVPRPTGTVGGVPNPWVYAYVEIADSVESARNSCLWGWQQNATGTATGGTTTTLVNSGAAWTTNQWQNLKVSIVGGTGAGQIAAIASNTATTLTFGALTTAPDATSQYIIGLDYTSGVHMTGTGNAVAGAALQAAAPSTFILY